MKLLIASVLFCTLAIKSCNITTNGFGNGIKGNKNVTSTEITIADYNQLKNFTSADIFYEQKPDNTPYLRLETDENLYECISIDVKDGILSISTKENINPSKFNIYTNSKDISNIYGRGSGLINLKNDISSNNLAIGLDGSGDIRANNIFANNLNIALKGSGDINLKNIDCTVLKSLVQGSGDIQLGGKASDAEFSVTGSGDIGAYKLTAGAAKCNVKGAGDIEVSVTDKLDATVTGSGDIKYKGSPIITRSKIKGSGDIRQK